MKHFKHLLFLSILCSLVLFNACSEDDANAIEANSKATLTVTASPSEGGSVSPQGGTYDAGTTVEVTATANTDYSFTNWTGDFEGSSNPVTLTMLTDQTLTANFEFQDADGDGIGDDSDDCSETVSGAEVDENGCADSQKDTDGDGVTDDLDICADTAEGDTVDENGCADSQKDTDGDGITDDLDTCPETIEGVEVDTNGCYIDALYLDENGVTIKAKENAVEDKVYYFNEKFYLVLSSSIDTGSIVFDPPINGDYSNFVTTRVTEMRYFFYGTDPLHLIKI